MEGIAIQLFIEKTLSLIILMVKLNIIETPLKIISPVGGTTKKPPDWWLLQKNERAWPPNEGVVGLGLGVGYWCSYSSFCSLLKWI